MKIAITGHRSVRLNGQEEKVRLWIKEQLINFRACYKDIELLNGMAKGVDQIAAQEAISLGVPLICFFAYKRKLSEFEENIAAGAERLIWVSDVYTGKSVYLERDRRMVDECDVLLVVWDGIETGGTYYTYKYAQEQGKKIIFYPWGLR